MSSSFLLELGMEEVPARFVPGAIEQLQHKMEAWLTEENIRFERSRTFATPRRLAIVVEGLADKQPDVKEEVRGPAVKAARDENGNWSKAALGFARSHNIEPDELRIGEHKGIPYVFADKHTIGQSTNVVLERGLADLIRSLSFPKHMRWSDHQLKYVRPIRWIVAMLDSDVIDVEITGVRSGNRTNGHRFLGGAAEIPSPDQYTSVMEQQYVIVDAGERRKRIVEQIEKLSSERGWQINVREDLLDEVVYLVEYPTVLHGDFDPEFLEVPQDVLITTMREHQRYFPVMDRQGKLLPHFVAVRNGDARSLEMVAKGNEKVLRARLSDARFFYREDLEQSIDQLLERLESVVYHEELGTIADKVRRIRAISARLCDEAGLDVQTKANVDRAAAICKFDLVTQMVYEFPELQGVMGEDYARKAGENEEVARAIFEHYQPRHAGDQSPMSTVGALVGIADKLDSLVGCFSIGIVPTGSQDPYALRRQAAGIVHILRDRELPYTLERLIDSALDILDEHRGLKRKRDEIRNDLLQFFALRVKTVLGELTTYDRVEAVMAAGFGDVVSVIQRAKALDPFVADAGNRDVLESFRRVSNLAEKAESATIREERFEQEAERSLFEAWTRLHEPYVLSLEEHKEAEALQQLATLKDAITCFFDEVMVMAEDAALRENRLALLASIDADLRRFADFGKLVRS